MASIEELVITLIYKSNGVEERLASVEKKLDEVKKANDSAQKSLDKTEASSAKAATGLGKAETGYKKVGQEARKAGDEAEKAGRKSARSADIFDKAQAKLQKGWTKALIGYMTTFVAAGQVIGFIKDTIAQTLESATAIGKVAEASGKSREEIHALGKAFESLGQSQESAYKYLENWSDGKYDKAAQTIGIKTQDRGQRREGSEVLLEMGRKAVEDSGGDRNLAAKRLQAIGLEEEAAKAAVRATKELIDEKKKSNLVSEEQIETAERVASRFRNFGSTVKDVAEAFGYALMPVIETVMDGIDGLISFFEGLTEGFNEAAGGAVTLADWLEVLFAPVTILKEFIDLLVGSLESLSGWTQTGGQMVFQFFNIARTVWNAVIGVINGMIAAIEGLINMLDNLGAAVANLTGGSYTPVGVKLGRLGEIGKGGAKAPSWSANPGRGAVRGSWGMPGAGRSVGGGGRSGGGRGRRGGGGRGRSGGGAGGKEEPVYRSTYQGTADPNKLGIKGAKGKIAEDPAKVAAREAKKTGGYSAGAKQVAASHANTVINNSITVYAQGNPNARDIANRTADAVNTVARRQAGAMA